MRAFSRFALISSLGLLIICGCFLHETQVSGVAFAQSEGPTDLKTAEDLYYQTDVVPLGPSARDVQSVYPRLNFVDNRVLVWLVTQQHTYFGGFVLALPFFCVILEFLGLTSRDPKTAQRYDGLARDVLKVALLALSMTAVLGSIMLGLFIA